MTEQDTQSANPAPAQEAPTYVNSVGRDEPEIVNAPEPEPSPEPPKIETADSQPDYTPEQVEEWREAKASLDQMVNDPKVRDFLYDYYKSKRGEQPKIHAETEAKPEQGQVSDEIMREIQDLRGSLQVAQLQLQHPELQDTAKLAEFDTFLKDNGLYQMPLGKTYDLYRRTQQSPTLQEPATPRLEQSEGGHRGGTDATQAPSKMEAAIKKARTSGDAVRAAVPELMRDLGMK